jgi:hypothetical protein
VQSPEPMLAQAFIPEFAIEALDIPVLHQLFRLYKLQFHLILIDPLLQCFASKFRSRVRSDSGRIASEAAIASGDLQTCSPNAPSATGLSRHSLVSLPSACASPQHKNPGLNETGVSGIKCLAMTYSHMGKPHTTIGDDAFHC